jgi:hypothetical protein
VAVSLCETLLTLVVDDVISTLDVVMLRAEASASAAAAARAKRLLPAAASLTLQAAKEWGCR